MGIHALINESQWVIEKLPKGGYRLKVGGSPTARIERNLYAVLLDQPPAEEWVITPRPQAGANAFT